MTANRKNATLVAFLIPVRLEIAVEITIAASWKSAPLRSCGRAQSEGRQTVGVLNSRMFEDFVEFIIAASWKSAPLRSCGCAHQAKRKTVCVSKSLIRCTTLREQTARCHKSKKPTRMSGLLLLLGAWRCATLAWQLPHYHRRSCVSLLSSEWSQVVPQRYCHQAKTCREQVLTRFSAARLRVKSMDGFDKNKFLISIQKADFLSRKPRQLGRCMVKPHGQLV